MDKKTVTLFESDKGQAIYELAVAAIKDYQMTEKIKGGVLVGLSGGADSVMLLHFLLEYKLKVSDFKILAVHINHSIRGAAADEDEEFSRELCKSLNIEFLSCKIDVPMLSKLEGVSIEECARNARYREFGDIICGRDDVSAVAVAHNGDDNLETIIANIFRGTGTRGASGIPPVRDNIIRPLIYVKKADIIDALDIANVKYVTDATNLEIEYKRNRIRHNIVPAIYSITDDPVGMATRLSHNLRIDDDFINCVAEDVLSGDNEIRSEILIKQHKAVQVRVLIKMAKTAKCEISAAVMDDICDLLPKNNFSYSLPGGAKFVCERGVCKILTNVTNERNNYSYRFGIVEGKNDFIEYDADFFLTDAKLDISSLNVYKISIQADLSSAIINGSLYLRPRKDGDNVFYGGMTRKIKKLFSDLKIPVSVRDSIPLLCDNSGIVWVPGFGVRDDGVKSVKKRIYATLAIGKGQELSDKRFRSASEYR